MIYLYNLLAELGFLCIRFAAVFNDKLSLFVQGRKQTFNLLSKNIKTTDRVIWMHVASLGEYEQGLPLLKKLKKQYPGHKLLLSFFSPSGYEVVKDKTPADVVVYLPFDTLPNAQKFLKIVHPELAVFIKYEFWPALLSEMEKQQIRVLSVSAIFRPSQVFFKLWGGWMRRSLKVFDHFFVQNTDSVALLKSIHIENVTLAGDTRFDRVSEILERDNRLSFMESFKGNRLCVVAGSTWPEDEALWLSYLKRHRFDEVVFVFAPHNVKTENIKPLWDKLPEGKLLYSEINPETDFQKHTFLVVDAIGLLTKIYAYADVAYVGGGMATGLHNVLEPAVFGIPVVIGKEYSKFDEATALVERGGVISIHDQATFDAVVQKLIHQKSARDLSGKQNHTYVEEKIGATETVMGYIEKVLKV
ncbi:MAG: 3-deoxy-D-manno-octulosonic acid transferase [Bacteroidetes bacterium]|nr:3-deoxy-D-manno-octulosonic acid transferase [Bacteroidota bacterium]